MRGHRNIEANRGADSIFFVAVQQHAAGRDVLRLGMAAARALAHRHRQMQWEAYRPAQFGIAGTGKFCDLGRRSHNCDYSLPALA